MKFYKNKDFIINLLGYIIILVVLAVIHFKSKSMFALIDDEPRSRGQVPTYTVEQVKTRYIDVAKSPNHIQPEIKFEIMTLDDLKDFVSSCVVHDLDTKIMIAIVYSINGTVNDVFKIEPERLDMNSQVVYFINKTQLMKNGKLNKTYYQAYLELYGEENLSKLYNSYEALFGEKLK